MATAVIPFSPEGVHAPPPVSIRRAEPADDGLLAQLVERFVAGAAPGRRFDWLYRKNPQGRAQSWLAHARPTGEIVGFTSIFARDLWVGGRAVPAGVGCDAFVWPAWRRRGVAMALHRASREAMARGEVPFRFMCGPPVAANLGALVKAGARVVGSLRYLGLPLTTEGLLDMLHFRHAGAGRPAESFRLLDRVLRGARQLASRAGAGITVRPVGRLDASFDRLFAQWAPAFGVIGRRDARTLGWRYLENPVCRQRLVVLERMDVLLGWAALEFSARGCLIVDYLLPLDARSARRAISALIRYVADQGACRMTLRANLAGAYAPLFRRHGFLPGWTEEWLQVLGGEPLGWRLLEPSGWHLTGGDLNPEASPWSVETTPPEGRDAQPGAAQAEAGA